MWEADQERKRRAMDEALLAFRVARTGSCAVEGWLREVRQAVGVPVKEVARRLGVSVWEVYRLEKSEMEAGIRLETLREAAKGLDCELVYALVPLKGSLGEMADRQQVAREAALTERRERAWKKRVAERKPWLEAIGWRPVILESLRCALRREGVRVRPRKTTRGDAGMKEALKLTMKLAQVTVSAEELEAVGIGKKRGMGDGD
jgi:predicted DNA-binding mobile mystery protein A